MPGALEGPGEAHEVWGWRAGSLPMFWGESKRVHRLQFPARLLEDGFLPAAGIHALGAWQEGAGAGLAEHVCALHPGRTTCPALGLRCHSRNPATLLTPGLTGESREDAGVHPAGQGVLK